MKKTFLILVFIVIGTPFVFAQNLQIYHNGNLMTNNQVINIQCGVTELVNLPLYVKNISADSIYVKLKKIENSLVIGSDNAFCFAGSCWGPTIMESPDFSIIF